MSDHRPRPPLVEGEKLRGERKLERIPVKVIPAQPVLRKPDWIRVRIPASPRIARTRAILRQHRLASVCEEASCPNLGECFHQGTATFMIMGDICTRRCPFCDVAHGKPRPLDPREPELLAQAIAAMDLKYVVITSVDRDDLPDSGAGHFVGCIQAVRASAPATRIEVLVPDFRGRKRLAIPMLAGAPPDVFNHNLETVPRLYRRCRPGADYRWSLELLAEYKRAAPRVPTKSGLMLGLGEAVGEVEEVLRDMRAHQVDMLTLGQYLQPSPHHLPVERYVDPAEFRELGELARSMGFSRVASAPLVRSSYHADVQAERDLL